MQLGRQVLADQLERPVKTVPKRGYKPDAMDLEVPFCKNALPAMSYHMLRTPGAVAPPSGRCLLGLGMLHCSRLILSRHPLGCQPSRHHADAESSGASHEETLLAQADDDDHLFRPAPAAPGEQKGMNRLYGHWQTAEWAPPQATGGRVPKNERGQVDVPPFAKTLPQGKLRARVESAIQTDII